MSYDDSLKPNARRLRQTLTDAERRLWSYLRSKQVCGIQFYRQKPIGRHIVDFYCAAAQLVVEADGGQHFEDAHMQADRQRDAELAALGLLVLRFDNRQVLAETEAVVEEIARVVAERLHSPKQTATAAKSPPAPLLQRGENTIVPHFEKGGTGGISESPKEPQNAH